MRSSYQINFLRIAIPALLIMYSHVSMGADCFTTTPISPNQTINATLDGTECFVNDFAGNGDYTYYDLYYLVLPSAGTLTITMESTELDSYLALLTEEFLTNPAPSTIITENDDYGATYNSRIDVYLEPGNYVIVANSYDDYDTGAYVLRTVSDVPDIDTDGDGIPDSSDADDDNDGMPDAYEIANSFNPLNASDALADADRDGYSNLSEYKAGTDPHDPESIPRARFMPWLPLLLD